MKRTTKKNYKSLTPVSLVNKEALTQEDKTKIKQIVGSRIKYLDELLEEQFESILLEDKELKLPREKYDDIILFAKQIYFQG